MRRSFAPAAATAGLCALALAACGPDNASIGTAASTDHTDQVTTAAAQGTPRSPVIPSPRPTPVAAPSASIKAATTATPAPAPTTGDPNVISFNGLHGVQIGQSVGELTAAGKLAEATHGCARQFVGVDHADPVFDHDRLAFIWAFPPLHTPEGIMVGDTKVALDEAYPNAERLTPPAGSPAFAGSFVRHPNGVAYLVLHDGQTVQKLIVGAEDAVRALYTQRLDTC
ncbi:hypothetical protein [Luedemannella helvata]